MDIFERAFKENKDPSLLAYMAWSIWNRRNQVRFNEEVCPLQRIDQLSKEHRAKFQNLHTASPKQKHEMHTKWEPPDLGVFKVNYDASKERKDALIKSTFHHLINGSMKDETIGN
nr:hypothetical protein CFP56_01793 [Quercus suber]